MRCGFCTSDIANDALVCPACARDVAIPAALLAERDQLMAARDRLSAELEAAQRALAARPARS